MSSVIFGGGKDRVEISCAERGEPQTPAAEDLLLVVTVVTSGFEGKNDAWVLRDAWRDFLAGMKGLDETRQGEASVESMSPGELRLSVQSLDLLGHLGVEGMIGLRSNKRTVRLEFSPIEFDPSQISEIVRGLSKFSDRS
jgi:hypothetical protein